MINSRLSETCRLDLTTGEEFATDTEFGKLAYVSSVIAIILALILRPVKCVERVLILSKDRNADN